MAPIPDADLAALTGHDVDREDLADWRIMFSELHARFETDDFASGVRLVVAIAALAETAGHHPDVDLAYSRVDVRLTSHDVGAVTRRDVRLAREISTAAASLGATPRPSETSVLELALDSADFALVKPFWAALLGYESSRDPDVELVDPDGTMPTIWGQSSQAHPTPHQRWHLDLRVPPEVAEARVAAALEAGGTVVGDGSAPAFWVLADAQGNQACITTWHGRD